MPEFKIINHVLDYMESTGSSAKASTVAITQNLVEKINSNHHSNYTLEDFEKAVAKCLANEWMEHAMLGSKRVTAKGIEAVRAKNKEDELVSSNSTLKKVSDYIDSHKGLFLISGSFITIVTFALNMLDR